MLAEAAKHLSSLARRYGPQILLNPPYPVEQVCHVATFAWPIAREAHHNLGAGQSNKGL